MFETLAKMFKRQYRIEIIAPKGRYDFVEFYPQYKSIITFGWKYFTGDPKLIGEGVYKFRSLEGAKAFIFAEKEGDKITYEYY